MSGVLPKLVIWEWEDSTFGLKNIKGINGDKELLDCCEKVVALHKRVLNGENVRGNRWIVLEDLTGNLYNTWTWTWSWAWACANISAGTWDRAWAKHKNQISIVAEKLLELLRESK